MGLAGPRKRAKYGHDPNNTAWSRSEGFGHSMLRSQGWTPGETLGAKNAPHAHLHTAASSSHIRVAMREDNLGLGAKKGSGQDAGQCTGLDVFQGLLGRLNGKSEDVLQKEQASRDQLKNILYTERRWGSMRFISGGILEGTDIKQLLDTSRGMETTGAPQTSTVDPAVTGEPTPIETEDTEMVEERDHTSGVDENQVSTKDRKRERKEEREKKDKKDKKEKRDKKERKRKRQAAVASENEEIEQSPIEPDNAATEPQEAASKSLERSQRDEKAQRKAEKAERKLRRQEKRAAKAIAVLSQKASAASSADEAVLPVNSAAEKNVISQPAPSIHGSRFAVRQRYVQHKRMAVSDPKALNEIFMIKAK